MKIRIIFEKNSYNIHVYVWTEKDLDNLHILFSFFFFSPFSFIYLKWLFY